MIAGREEDISGKIWSQLRSFCTVNVEQNSCQQRNIGYTSMMEVKFWNVLFSVAVLAVAVLLAVQKREALVAVSLLRIAVLVY